jgi:hypothetical protein
MPLSSVNSCTCWALAGSDDSSRQRAAMAGTAAGGTRLPVGEPGFADLKVILGIPGVCIAELAPRAVFDRGILKD